MRAKITIGTALLLLALTGCLMNAASWAVAPMTAESVNAAVKYGMTSKDAGISSLMGYNWQEGPNGTLLNVYTPFMEIARKVYHKKNLSSNPTAQEVAEAKKKVIKDIDYLWQHPYVKFMVSMYGPDASFGKNYYAVIEGVGKGRNFRIMPAKIVPQTLAVQDDPNAKDPSTSYSAVNTYYFKFIDIERLDAFTLRIYGKDMPEIQFKLNNKRLL